MLFALPARRFKRAERFALTDAGVTAAEAYLREILSARASHGRLAFEHARATWAKAYGGLGEDVLLLRELLGKTLSVADLAMMLDGYGPNMDGVRDGLTRLIEGGLVAPIERPTRD